MAPDAEREVFPNEKTCTIDQKAEREELQSKFSLMGVLTKIEETLVIGLFKILPTGGKVLDKLLVNFLVTFINLQTDLFISSE